MDVTKWLRGAREGLRHWSCPILTVFCVRFKNHGTVIDMEVEHFEYFDGVFAYHILFCNGAIALCLFGVRSMDGPNLWHVIHGCNICNTFIHAN